MVSLRWVKTAAYDNMTPTDNTSLGQVIAGSVADVDAACEAAENAAEAWADMPGAQRRALLHKFADELERRADEIALVESMDCGQPIRFMKQAAVRGAANFRLFADKAAEAQNGLALHQTSTLTTLSVSRSVLLASSRHGIHRLCYLPGRSLQRCCRLYGGS